MYLADALSILDNEYPKGIHNIIVHIIDMVLKYGTMIFPHDIAQLKPQLLLKVLDTIISDGGLLFFVTPVYLNPSPRTAPWSYY